MDIQNERQNEKFWVEEDGEYKLFGKMFPDDKKARCMALMITNLYNKELYAWLLMDFENGYIQPSKITPYNMDGSGFFNTLEEAKERIEILICDRIKGKIDDLNQILRLFET